LKHPIAYSHAAIISECRCRVADLCKVADSSYRQGGAEYLQVVMVDQIAESRFATLVEARELIEIEWVSVRHDAAMKSYEETLLIDGIHRRHGAEATGSLGDQQSLVVMGISV